MSTENAKPDAPPAEAPKKKGAGKLFLVLFLAGFFTLGYLPSWLVRKQQLATNASIKIEHEHNIPEELQSGNGLSWKKGIEKGDLHLKIQDFQEALNTYQKIRVPTEGHKGSVWYYRQGLCFEGMGQWEEALILYGKAGQGAGSMETRLLAQLGQARMLIKLQRGHEAIVYMHPWIFIKDQWAEWKHAIHETWLLSLVEDSLHASLEKKNLLDHFPRPYPFPELQVFLEKLPEEAPHPPDAELPPEKITIRREKGKSARVIAEQILLHRQPIEDILSRIGKEAEMKIQVSPRAKERLHGREAQLEVREWPLTNLLDHLAASWDLVGKEDDEGYRFVLAAEISQAEINSQRRQRVRQALRQEAVKSPEDHHMMWVHWKLAELEWEAGNTEPIKELVQPLLREITLWRAPAYYLVGLCEMDEGKFTEARKAFFQVVDQDPQHALAGYAYFQLARLAWEERQNKQAKLFLQRASAKSLGTALHPILILNLAMATIFDKAPSECQALLIKHRSYFLKEPYRGTAKLLDALATFQIVKTKGPARKEVNELLSAFLESPADPYLGGMGMILRTQVCKELNMLKEANDIYERAQHDIKGPLRSALLLGQADILLELEFPEASQKLLKAVMERKDKPWCSLAKLQLASLHLKEKAFRESVALCHSLYHDELLQVDANVLFQVWGQAYLQLAEPAKAARCFSGLPPE